MRAIKECARAGKGWNKREAVTVSSFMPQMSAILLALVSLHYSLWANAAPPTLTAELRQEEFSLSRNALALRGYDPVSYFQHGPRKGSKAFSDTYAGVRYHFVNAKNREHFRAKPEQYEPQYGGWCAWAMYDEGGRTEANPESYKIVDGKLYVFYDGLWGDTRQLWNEETDDIEESGMIRQADAYWAAQTANP